MLKIDIPENFDCEKNYNDDCEDINNNPCPLCVSETREQCESLGKRYRGQTICFTEKWTPLKEAGVKQKGYEILGQPVPFEKVMNLISILNAPDFGTEQKTESIKEVINSYGEVLEDCSECVHSSKVCKSMADEPLAGFARCDDFENKPVLFEKKKCFITVCNNTEDIIFYNKSTREYYCCNCAILINEGNASDSQRFYGEPLCLTDTKDTPEEYNLKKWGLSKK